MKYPQFKYVEWKSPEELHYSAQQWNSTLSFIKDEHLFFEDMLKEYTLPIIESHLFSKIKALIIRLDDSKKAREELSKKVEKHHKGLEILLDGKDQPEEEKEYKEEHRKLMKEVHSFAHEYKLLKMEIFDNVSSALKQQKQKRLLS